MQVSQNHTAQNITFNAAHNIMKTFLYDQSVGDLSAERKTDNPFAYSNYIAPVEASQEEKQPNLDEALFGTTPQTEEESGFGGLELTA